MEPRVIMLPQTEYDSMAKTILSLKMQVEQLEGKLEEESK